MLPVSVFLAQQNVVFTRNVSFATIFNHRQSRTQIGKNKWKPASVTRKQCSHLHLFETMLFVQTFSFIHIFFFIQFPISKLSATGILPYWLKFLQMLLNEIISFPWVSALHCSCQISHSEQDTFPIIAWYNGQIVNRRFQELPGWPRSSAPDNPTTHSSRATASPP